YRGVLPPPVPPPPPQGSIQVKAAWLKLPGNDPKDFPTWHTAVAQYYVSGPDGKPVAAPPALFVLVGMHIIHGIHTTDPKDPMDENGTGGTFIFATWEHESIFDSPVAGMPDQPEPSYFYSNFFGGQKGIPLPPKGFYPALDKAAYPV